MAYVITQDCIGTKDRGCVEVCPVSCIFEVPEGSPNDPGHLFIDPDECIDCGACEPACPAKAIFPEDDVPDKWKSFISAARELVSREDKFVPTKH